MLHQIDGVMSDLLGQFTGWANDQSTRCGGFEVACVGRVFALGALRRWLAFGFGLGHCSFKLSALLGFGFGLLLQQGVQHRQQECRCFAATCLARHHQVDETRFGIGVVVWQSQRNGFLLNRGGLGVTQVFHSLHQLRCQAQQNETVGGFGLLNNCFGVSVNRFCRNSFRRDGFWSGNRNSFGRRKFACHI